MKKYFFQRNKYLLASSGLFLGSLYTNSIGLQLVGSGVFIYNYFERIGFLEVDYNPEMVIRRLALNEYVLCRLLRDHLLKAEVLNRWMTQDSLMLAKPVLNFEDQGLIGLLNLKFGFGLFKKQEFIMNTKWKDMKFHGEGTAYCTGHYTDMNNYYFSSIYIDMIKPRKEKLVILEDNTIDIS